MKTPLVAFALAFAATAVFAQQPGVLPPLGVKVGKPYSITEEADSGASSNNWNSNRNLVVQVSAAALPSGDGTVPTFAPGTISISASVNVSFFLE